MCDGVGVWPWGVCVGGGGGGGGGFVQTYWGRRRIDETLPFTCGYITCTVQSMTVMDYNVFGDIWQLAIYIKSRLSLG